MDAMTKTTEPTVVNGINVDNLKALVASIEADPAKAMTSWRVATTWQGPEANCEVDDDAKRSQGTDVAVGGPTSPSRARRSVAREGAARHARVPYLRR